MQAYVYCRVSSEEQASDNHYSLENQEKRAREYCNSKDWRVSAIRKDIGSGKDTNRDGFQELVSAVTAKRVDVVLVYRLDRLSRNVRNIYDFLDLISKNQVALVSICESLDTTTAMGRAMLGVMAVFAQLTREMIAENVKDGILRRVQSGFYIGPKSGPLGYRYDPSLNTLISVPEEARIVQQIFELFVERKWGVDKITRYIIETGTVTKSNANWHPALISRVLRNPVCIGKVRLKGQVYDSNHEPIIPPDTFQAAQEIISSKSSLPGRVHQSQHLLSGLAICGVCGKKLIGHFGVAKKNGERYVFYFHRPSKSPGGCNSFYRSAPKLERLVVSEIRKAAESGLLSTLAEEELGKELHTKITPLRARKESIVLELAGLKDKFNAWADRLDRGLIDEDQFSQQNSKLLEVKKQLQSEMKQIESKLMDCDNADISLAAARESLSKFPNVWEHLEIEEQRELLRLLIEKLEVHKEHLIIKLVFLPEETVALK